MRQWQMTLVGVLGLAGAAQGALQPVVNGQVYDNVLGINWLQDANVFRTLCDAGDPLATEFVPVDAANAAAICASEGAMSWNDAQAWIARLNAGNYLGVNTWRQWVVPAPTNDPTCSEQNFDGAGSDHGYNCAGSELGHLFNVTLGNPDEEDDSCDPGCLQHTGPFSNFRPEGYWSGTEYAPDPSDAWGFRPEDGGQSAVPKTTLGFVWPVRPPAVAIPALPFWGLGLLGLLLAGLAGRRLR
jgi:hypothetical protein